jgi:hypothetical protein
MPEKDSPADLVPPRTKPGVTQWHTACSLWAIRMGVLHQTNAPARSLTLTSLVFRPITSVVYRRVRITPGAQGRGGLYTEMPDGGRGGRGQWPYPPARGRPRWSRVDCENVDYVGELGGFWAWKSMMPPLSNSQATAS